MAEIVLDRVTKEFDNGFVAIDDVSLTVADGEFLVLVGPSGCGKSTLLRMIAGLEEVTAGTVSIGGSDVTAATGGSGLTAGGCGRAAAGTGFGCLPGATALLSLPVGTIGSSATLSNGLIAFSSSARGGNASRRWSTGRRW